MDLKSKSCKDLNNQLAIYQAFRNTHGVATVLVRHAAESGEIPRMGELIPSGNGDDQADYGLLGNNR